MPRLLSFHQASARTSAVSHGLITTLLASALFLAPTGTAHAAWGIPCPTPKILTAPPDQSWMKDVPEKPGARVAGKVAVFTFKGDDVYEQARGAVVRALRKQGLTVFASLRPSDSPTQYRDVSISSGLGLFIDGEVTGDGPNRTINLKLRSGVTGQYFTATKFTGPASGIASQVERSLWAKVGPATVRVCASASKPRKRGSTPTYIEAGSPLDSPLYGS